MRGCATTRRPSRASPRRWRSTACAGSRTRPTPAATTTINNTISNDRFDWRSNTSFYKVKQKIEDICSSYEQPEEMAAAYFGNPQIMARLEPLVLEEQAVDWLVEHGKPSTRKVSFKEYMKP